MKKQFTAKTAYWKIMKLCAIQMILPLLMTCLASAHENYGQILKKRITITVKDVTLEEVLRKIEEAGDVKFYYSIDQLNVDALFSLDVTNKPLREVLDQVLSPHQIGYRVHERESAITLKRSHGESVGSLLIEQKVDATDKAHLAPVSGRIIDSQTALPMAGVNVIVKGTTLGTTTDADGRFTISAEETDILVFSFIGYKTVEIEVRSQTFIEVSMVEDVSALDEVVVFASGYEEISPERSTGSYTNIGPELLQRNVGTDIFSRLNGLAPSLLIDERNGGRPLLNIRGRSTILADDQPLIVVDNFPYNGDLNTINPNDIESITVLRDAAAASIWGVRAGNGVIVITTKRGSVNQPLQLSFNSNVTVGEKPDVFYQSRMTTSDFIDVEKFLFDNGYFNSTITDARKPALSPAVEILLDQREGNISEPQATEKLDELRGLDVRKDINDYFYQNRLNQQYSLSLTAGGDKHSFYFSGGYDKNRDQRVGNDYRRISLNSQYTLRPLRNLDVDTRLVYTHTGAKSDNTLGALRMGSRNLYPYARLADDNGSPLQIVNDYREDFVGDAVANGFLDWGFRPIDELRFSDTNERLTYMRSATGLRYTFKNLTLEARYQYESQEVNGRDLKGVETYFTRNLINQYSEVDASGVVTRRNIPEGGILTFNNSLSKTHNGRLQLNFKKDWEKHALTALAGAEVRQTDAESFTNRLYGYDPNLGSAIPVDFSSSFLTYPVMGYGPIPGFHSVGATLDRFRSFFANAAYTFDNRYVLSASGRVDQSNLFGVTSNQKSAPLWSAGGRWNISNEKFFSSDVLPFLSFKATYGYNGNIDRNVTAFTTARFLSAQWSRRNAARLTAPPNPSLRWERIRMLNLGLDFRFGNGIVDGSIEFFTKRGHDLIGLAELDPTVGFRSFKGNVASLAGHGWDVIVKVMPVDRKVQWNSTFFFSYAIDKVTSYPVEPTSLSLYFIDSSIERTNTVDFAPNEGRPLFSIYSRQWAGLDPDNGKPRGYLGGVPSTDYVAMRANTTVDSLVYHGPALAPYFGSLRNTVSYKGLSISFNITYRFGHFFRATSVSYSSLFSNYTTHGDFAHRWQQAGDEERTHVPSMVYPVDPLADSFYLTSEVLVHKGDNIRLQDIQVQYDFKPFTLGRTQIGSITAYAYLNNLGILWKANPAGIDPDFPAMPPPKTYAIGLRTNI